MSKSEKVGVLGLATASSWLFVVIAARVAIQIARIGVHSLA